MALDLMGYIKKSSKRPNRAILESLGASQELIEYLMETPGNTNWKVVEAIGGSSGGNPDCEHTELGELMYCGSASNKTIVNADGTYDEGVQENYRNSNAWLFMRTNGLWVCTGVYIAGVFDGQTVIGEKISENSMAFGEYLSIAIEEDADTGNPRVIVGELTGASHYALYTSADGQHSDLGCLYYCGSLQNGNIIDTETGTHDAGVVTTDEQAWETAISATAMGDGAMYLVSNGDTVTATATSENSVVFGNIGLSREVNAETGDERFEISNAPSHYAVYFNPGQI